MRQDLSSPPHRLDRVVFAAMVTLLAAASMLLFGIGLGGGFIFDDYPNLVHDPHWRLKTAGIKSLLEAIGNGSSGFGGRPLALLTFALDHLRAGPDPAALKLTNVALHALNTILAFLLLRSLVYFAWATEPRTPRVELFAFAVALVWSLHPLQVSTVLYIVQRMEIGATTFILIACLAYMQARTGQIAGQRGWGWLLVAATSTLIGLGFKESAVLAPVFAVLIEVSIFRFAGPRHVSRWLRRTWAAAFAFALIVFVLVVIPQYATEGNYEFRDFTASQRVLTQGPVLVHYISQILLPVPDRLVFYYDNFPISRGFLSPLSTGFAWGLISVLLVIAVRVRRRLPLVSFGIVWFFAGHLLTSNVVPLEIAFEHRNYLALLGPVLALADVGRRASSRLHLDARLVAEGTLIASVVGLSALQVMTWADPMRLATALASRNIDSPRASYSLGRELFEQSRNDTRSPSWSLAKKELLHAAELDGRSPLPEQALIIMHARDGTRLPRGIWPSLQAKYAKYPLSPEFESAIWQLANCRQLAECPLDAELLLQTFIAALERNPDSPRLHSVYATFAYAVLQDPELGIAMMREAVALAPTDAQFKANLARFLACRPGAESEVESLVHVVRNANRAGTYTEDLATIDAQLATCAPSPRRAAPPPGPPTP